MGGDISKTKKTVHKSASNNLSKVVDQAVRTGTSYAPRVEKGRDLKTKKRGPEGHQEQTKENSHRARVTTAWKIRKCENELRQTEGSLVAEKRAEGGEGFRVG